MQLTRSTVMPSRYDAPPHAAYGVFMPYAEQDEWRMIPQCIICVSELSIVSDSCIQRVGNAAAVIIGSAGLDMLRVEGGAS